jgi:hypothetical protein
VLFSYNRSIKLLYALYCVFRCLAFALRLVASVCLVFLPASSAFFCLFFRRFHVVYSFRGISGFLQPGIRFRGLFRGSCFSGASMSFTPSAASPAF